MKKIKNVKKRWIRNVVGKLTNLIKPNEKFPGKITVLNMHDNFWGLRLFMR